MFPLTNMKFSIIPFSQTAMGANIETFDINKLIVKNTT